MLYRDFSFQITVPSLMCITYSQNNFSLDTPSKNISGSLGVILEDKRRRLKIKIYKVKENFYICLLLPPLFCPFGFRSD